MAQPGKGPGCAYRMDQEAKSGKKRIVKSNGKWKVMSGEDTVHSINDDYNDAVKAAGEDTDYNN